MLVSVVIPTWNEAANIAACIASAIACGANEVIVVDGGSSDDTVNIVRRECQANDAIRMVESDPGRGVQLASGAEQATGDVLLFLHADNRLPMDAIEQMRAAGWPKWGGFHQRIDDDRWRFRMLEWGNAMRARWRSNLFGDQAIYVHCDLYHHVGGFAGVALMEDVMISRELRRHAKPVLLPGPLHVNARRWHARGVIRQTWLNWRIQWAFARGMEPDELRRWYSGS